MRISETLVVLETRKAYTYHSSYPIATLQCAGSDSDNTDLISQRFKEAVTSRSDDEVNTDEIKFYNSAEENDSWRTFLHCLSALWSTNDNVSYLWQVVTVPHIR